MLSSIDLKSFNPPIYGMAHRDGTSGSGGTTGGPTEESFNNVTEDLLKQQIEGTAQFPEHTDQKLDGNKVKNRTKQRDPLKEVTTKQNAKRMKKDDPFDREQHLGDIISTAIRKYFP